MERVREREGERERDRERQYGMEQKHKICGNFYGVVIAVVVVVSFCR